MSLRVPSPLTHRDDDWQEHPGASFFSNARDFTVNGGQFQLTQTNNYVNNAVSDRRAVFEILKPHACLDATKDSSARHPPPRCHPGTREKIRERLMQWLLTGRDEWMMLWVRGFAGTGKSAVAQSFADSCEEGNKFGGSYFFSRTAGRNKIETVVPTLAYQLAGAVPEYRSFIEHQLANNPILLQNSPPVQFRKLIVEPFASLHLERPQEPIAVILDGLDECEGETAQREILEMITNAIRTNPNLPLRWLIFSRPEAHLKNAFSRNVECGREELIIDAECRANVERYVEDRLVEIKATYCDVTPADWPSKEKLEELLDAVAGLFVLASTCINYIGDPEEADPDSQLDSLLAFMRRLKSVVSRNPLASLDLLYSRILEDIPHMVFKTTSRILGYLSLQSRFEPFGPNSAQELCNFLRLSQRDFYKAFRGLYSVMRIPEPEDVAESQIQFHHASFQDFLLDPNRSGKFAIDSHKVLVDVLKSGIFWYDVDVTHFHTDDGWEPFSGHGHGSLPGLTWTSDAIGVSLSMSIQFFVRSGLFDTFVDVQLDHMDENVLSQISNIDFRYWRAGHLFAIARVCRLDLSTSIVRTEPSGPTDQRLLEYLNRVIRNGVSKPAIFPLPSELPDGRWIREYFFFGHGDKSVIVWTTKSPRSHPLSLSLRCDKEPSDTQVSAYEQLLQKIKWDEEKAKSEMI
ncbi:hypothetical protein Agabi119p4_6208 [Agaricus bisporus var. burnettii]|uniref:Nephrocystin 3-like N-terminal domain-containing protein n=1 Tax=Agaricus bisporus var. burnettii TaxID=192524 RepID=A0A8H7C884_AGABI|nr:hypothetical protein Agabi119p4_6208 [Agaricus bisporus var. burnettii]